MGKIGENWGKLGKSSEKWGKVAKWQQHFSNLLNSHTDTSHTKLVMDNLKLMSSDKLLIEPADVYEAVCSLRNGKSAGLDGLYAEHFKFSHDKLHSHPMKTQHFYFSPQIFLRGVVLKLSCLSDSHGPFTYTGHACLINYQTTLYQWRPLAYPHEWSDLHMV